MVYILETELSENKSVFLALKNIYGIGKSKSVLICKQLGFCVSLKVKELSDDQITKLLKLIESSDLIITSDLKKLKQLVTKNLVAIKSYRGLRRINGFPVRGQRTHTNAKTAKRNRRSNKF
jgi:small subunit ribosomal protein S13